MAPWSIERAGVNRVEALVNNTLQWVFREQPIVDYGIDGHIETVTQGRPNGGLLGVQIKSGPHYFKEERPDAFVYRGDQEHLSYWLSYGIPVIIVITDQERGTFWQHVTHDNVYRTQ